MFSCDLTITVMALGLAQVKAELPHALLKVGVQTRVDLVLELLHVHRGNAGGHVPGQRSRWNRTTVCC